MMFQKGDIVEIVANHPEEVIGSTGIVIRPHEEQKNALWIRYVGGLSWLDDSHEWWTGVEQLRKIGHVEE